VILVRDPDTADVGRNAHRLRADAARNRERTLEAAAEVFAERGLGATLNDVAHHAGLGIGTVYRRFPNKEALIEALFENKVSEAVALATEALAHPNAWDGVVTFLERMLQIQVLNKGFRDVLLHGPQGEDLAANFRSRITPPVTQLIGRCQAEGSLRADFVVEDVSMLIIMIGSVADYTRDDDPELWRRYLTLFVDGLATLRSSVSPLGAVPTAGVVAHAMGRLRKGPS
jgi:AcrR family transcriptional regulator